MLTGKQALGSIETAMAEAQREISATNNHIKEISEALGELRSQEIAAYKELADIRMESLGRDEMVRHLNDAEALAHRLLGERSGDLQRLESDLVKKNRLLEDLQQRRDAAVDQVQEASDTLDDGIHATQQRLAEDAEFAAQAEAAQAAEAIAVRAERKAELAEQDRQEKGAPYEADPLFIYLWRRRYGTSEYSAFPLFRYFDGLVAKLCNFNTARANYHMLLEIPKRLNEHVDHVRAAADAEAEKLEALEHKGLAEDGVSNLQAGLASAEQQQSDIEAEIDQAQSDIQALLEQQTHFSTGADEGYQQAVQALVSAYRNEDSQTLFRAARHTPITADDVIVAKIEDLNDKGDALVAEVDRYKDVLRTQEKRLQELEAVRQEFRRQRFDSAGSTFADGNMVAMLISHFLRGALSSGNFWESLRRQQRFRRRRANPGFGSGGLRRRRSGASPWGGGFGRGGFGGSGGGFRTGGSMGGGGGFRTGGGF